jgi:N-acetylmuramoyl-L-alanine amidase
VITVQPAILIECGFLSNAEEALRLNCPDYQKKVAFTIYKGIMGYLNAQEIQHGNNQNAPHGLRMQ